MIRNTKHHFGFWIEGEGFATVIEQQVSVGGASARGYWHIEVEVEIEMLYFDYLWIPAANFSEN